MNNTCLLESDNFIFRVKHDISIVRSLRSFVDIMFNTYIFTQTKKLENTSNFTAPFFSVSYFFLIKVKNESCTMTIVFKRITYIIDYITNYGHKQCKIK